ncbi:MAG: hypothetical protein EBZ87_03140 [Microbacteriaceae bacterium]|nr:hypothetical protein [Microbacteriaceae bacterium]
MTLADIECRIIAQEREKKKMTHNEVAILVLKAVHQEERHGGFGIDFNSALRQDFKAWDNGGEPTGRLLSALRNCVCDHPHDVGRLNTAIKILDAV